MQLKIDFLDVMTYPLQSSKSGWFTERSSSKRDVDRSEGLAGDAFTDAMAHEAQRQDV